MLRITHFSFLGSENTKTAPLLALLACVGAVFFFEASKNNSDSSSDDFVFISILINIVSTKLINNGRVLYW